jgi:hypothetical protein
MFLGQLGRYGEASPHVFGLAGLFFIKNHEMSEKRRFPDLIFRKDGLYY